MRITRYAAIAASALTATFMLGITASAEEVYEKGSVTAHYYELDDTKQIECIFKQELPEEPYISAEDYLEGIFTADFSVENDGEGVYTVEGNGVTFTVDTESDKVVLTDFEKIFTNNIAADEESSNDFIKISISSEGKEKELDFSAYDIDLLGVGDEVYFPLSVISDLFGASYNGAAYVGGDIYFSHTADHMDGKFYYDRSPVFQTDERSEAMKEHTYNVLCFLMDNLYGAPPKSVLAESINEKGFDKTLDEYSEVTQGAKKYLMGDKLSEYLYGLYVLDGLLNDGGHTMISASYMFENNSQHESAVQTNFRELKDLYEDIAKPMRELEFDMIFDDTEDVFSEARTTKYSEMELIKEWEDTAALYVDGDTAIFVFDHFINTVVEPFKWSVDYASQNGVKNFIVDLSCNGGGDSDVVCYMLAIMGNKNRDNNTSSYLVRNRLTGNIVTNLAELDLDLNGVIDDKDKEVGYDLNFAVLTSRISFSCGNLMPCLAQEMGIPVIGETSGGGTCMVVPFYHSNAIVGQMSWTDMLLTSDHKDVDSGVAVDYALPTDDEKKLTFYDVAKMREFINSFYGVTDTSESESSAEESEQKADSSSKAVSASTATNPSTGASFGMVAMAIVAAVAVSAKKKNR
ncbi:MAG: hypothetical protein IJ645_06120 [Ruminococcus sp.]|nr:hypothetical protein [Ruminococcus sp.]